MTFPLGRPRILYVQTMQFISLSVSGLEDAMSGKSTVTMVSVGWTEMSNDALQDRGIRVCLHDAQRQTEHSVNDGKFLSRKGKY